MIDERTASPVVVVIFGASRDLTARKLGPAVENLARHTRIPAEFRVVGVARTQMDPVCMSSAARSVGQLQLLPRRTFDLFAPAP